MWDLIVSVPDLCSSFYFSHDETQIISFLKHVSFNMCLSV